MNDAAATSAPTLSRPAAPGQVSLADHWGPVPAHRLVTLGLGIWLIVAGIVALVAASRLRSLRAG